MLELCVERKDLLAPKRPQVPDERPSRPGGPACVDGACSGWCLAVLVSVLVPPALLDSLQIFHQRVCTKLRWRTWLAACVFSLGCQKGSAWGASQNADTRQLLHLWYTGRASLLAVVLNYVLGNVSAKLGAGAGCAQGTVTSALACLRRARLVQRGTLVPTATADGLHV